MTAPRATFGRDFGLQERMLLKISDGMQRVSQRDLRAAGDLNAFFIVLARAKGTLLSTHPPMEQRIAALARREAELQRPAPAAA